MTLLRIYQDRPDLLGLVLINGEFEMPQILSNCGYAMQLVEDSHVVYLTVDIFARHPGLQAESLRILDAHETIARLLRVSIEIYTS